MASIITGVDGNFAPVTDYTLPYRADGIFDFSAINIGNGTTLRFDTQMQNVTLLSLGDILIAGGIEAPGINLTLETLGQIVFTGSISAYGISLTGNQITATGIITSGGLCLGRCDPPIPPIRVLLPPDARLPLPPRIDLIRSVPEPSTLWLVMLLPMLALLPKRQPA
jgi:hypothetical protein